MVAPLKDPERFLRHLFATAVSAADPERVLSQALPPVPPGRTVVVGAGKGAAQLARAFEQEWSGPIEGLVVTRYGFGVPCERVEVVEAAHPVPDEAGLQAAERLLALLSGLGPDDLVVALICGGGSALLPAPPAGFTLADDQLLTDALLRSGMPIGGMNAVRKHFSRIKGGQLALAAGGARVVSLIVSDVPGDDPAEVASGPTVPGVATRQTAASWLTRYGVSLPDRIHREIVEGPEIPAPGDRAYAGHEVRVISSAGQSLAAAASEAERLGLRAVILSDSMEGEARELGQTHAAIAREIALQNQPFERPVVMLSGGEATVTLRGTGRGGPNAEFLLAFAMGVEGLPGVHALAADTDGIDGSEENAGAFCDETSLGLIRAASLDPQALLDDNDSWQAFSAAKGLFEPGPTGTNVNDFRAILVA